VKYAIRIAANDNLERDIAGLLTRPVGRPSTRRWSGTRASCTSGELEVARRWWRRWSSTLGVVPRVGFIVTN